MSHSPSLAGGPAPRIALPRAGVIAGIVITACAAAAVASVVTLAWMGTGPAATEARNAQLPAPPVVQPTPGTSVPDASQVFKGREFPTEEPAPTF